jgi:cholera toxin transcriptional activator
MLNSSADAEADFSCPMAAVSKYKFDAFEADLSAAELRKNGTRLKLQLQPFQVLVTLLECPGEVVTREDLRQRLWPQDTFVDFDHSLNTAMVKLRDVLGDSASNPKYIETIAKRGYRFLGTAQIVAESPASMATKAPASLETSQSAAKSNTEADPTLPRASRNTARILFVLAQIMYLIFYLSALFSLDNTYKASFAIWHKAGTAIFSAYLTTSMIGVAVRLYLISATAMDYHLLGNKYRLLMPWLFSLDMIWALAPLLIIDRIGLGFALGACAALIYMPFAQRTLIQMMRRQE